MTKKHVPHNKICYACRTERGRTHLGYDIQTLKTYCLKNCPNEDMIPSVPLIPVTELVNEIVSTYSEDVENSLMKLMGTIASTRLQPAHIMHLVKLQEMEGLPSVQATLINIIEADMDARSMDDIELERNEGAKPEPEEVKEVVKPKPAKKKKPEPKVVEPEPEVIEEEEVEDDDEFTF